MAGFFRGIGRLFGILLILLGIAVFVIRLQHAGPYAMPEGGNLIGAVLAFVIGLWFLRPFLRSGSLPHIIGWPAVLATPVVMFFTLFSILGEVEEVISVTLESPNGTVGTYRLWVVDLDGTAWTTMRDEKAETAGFDNTTGQMLRNGESSCVTITRHDDMETLSTIHDMKYEKYAAMRFAVMTGVFQRQAQEASTAVEFAPCP